MYMFACSEDSHMFMFACSEIFPKFSGTVVTNIFLY